MRAIVYCSSLWCTNRWTRVLHIIHVCSDNYCYNYKCSMYGGCARTADKTLSELNPQYGVNILSALFILCPLVRKIEA